MRRAVLIPFLLILAIVAAYWRLAYCEFLNFDDGIYVTNNPHVFRGLHPESVQWAFTTGHACNWHPLTWLSHMLDCQFFSSRACAHHMVNLLFHAANTLLLFWVLQRITGRTERSAMVAALFALHPLHVESVAWVAERKDVLSTFFWMLTLWAYARYVEKASPRRAISEENPTPKFRMPEGTTSSRSLWYGLALLWFALGLMSKPMLVTLPFALLLLDYWPLERLKGNSAGASSQFWTIKQLVIEKLPFFVLAAASSVATFLVQYHGGAVIRSEVVPFHLRVANAVVAYASYLLKMVWPRDLIIFYTHPVVWPVWCVVGAALLLAGISFVVFRARRRPYLTVGWLWYLGTLIPVIGLVQVGGQFMADRYSYVPLIGVFIMIIWMAADSLAGWPSRRVALALGGALAIFACLYLTNLQVRYWQNSVTLFSHALEVDPESAIARRTLGQALSLKGRQEEAISQLEEALRLKPDFPEAHLDLGNSLNLLGKLEEAMPHYAAAIELKPSYELAYYHLGNGLAAQGRLREAQTNLQTALQLKPDYAEAHAKLGNVLVLQGRLAEAIPHYQTALAIWPDYAEGHYFLASALARKKEFPEAVRHFYAALKSNPDDASACNDLAWILATDNSSVRNLSEAIRLAESACRLTHQQNPMYLDTLGVAYSEASRFQEAISVTQRAVDAALARQQPQLAARFESRLNSYQQGHSYRSSLESSNRQ